MKSSQMKRKMVTILLLFCMLLNLCIPGFQTTAADSQEEEPILTIACLSDLHNQMSLIEGDVDSVKLRGTVTNTLKAIKEQENIDMMILCGDYTSDSSDIPYENWLRIRELMVDATRDAFPDDAESTPVLWVDGNHDYEITRDYNAGDYYTYPMKEDIGELPAEDCYYESTSDGSYDLLAAYYYEIDGFDFLCLNTGSLIYDHPNGATDSYNSYQYSLGSVQWVEKKLDEIYADNPDKTVFFVTHIPFDDSNSINTGKGMDADDEATLLLKQTLAKHPNLIHLYGHDHGKDSAYVRTDTAQRVTQYDTDGNKITSETTSPLWTIQTTEGGYTIQNVETGKYLGYDGNMTTVESATTCGIQPVDGSTAKYQITVPSAEKPNLYFSTSSNTFSANTATCDLSLYVQSKKEDGTYEYVPATEITDGGVYLIVKEGTENVYALTNETNGSTGSNLRMVPTSLEQTDGKVVYEEETSTALPSFITSFVGSMRYYSNSIDGASSPNDSQVVQALMVYVYKDRVELQMKNYGNYDYYDTEYPGTSIVINKTLLPYTSYRTVYSNYAFTSDLSDLVSDADRLDLSGYDGTSIKEFASALGKAKSLLNEDVSELQQEDVDNALDSLQTAKDNLTPVKETETETESESEKETDAANIPETDKNTAQENTNQTEANQTGNGSVSGTAVAVPALTKPVLTAKTTKANKVKLSWKKQATATGYQIQIKVGKQSYKTLKKISKNTKIKLTTGKLKKGTYKFRIRAYATYTDEKQVKQTVFGKYSKAVTVKIKK